MTRKITFSTGNKEFNYSFQLSTDVLDIAQGVLQINFTLLDLLFKNRRNELRLLRELKQGARFHDPDNNCEYIITRINKEEVVAHAAFTIVFVDVNTAISKNYTYNISNFGTMSLNINSILNQADQIVNEMPLEDKELANELLIYLKSNNHLEKGCLSRFKDLLLNNTDFGSLVFEIIKMYLTK